MRREKKDKGRKIDTTEQEEVDAEAASDTHSIVWMVHGAVAPVLLDTEG